jgi:hypothetical protein
MRKLRVQWLAALVSAFQLADVERPRGVAKAARRALQEYCFGFRNQSKHAENVRIASEAINAAKVPEQ